MLRHYASKLADYECIITGERSSGPRAASSSPVTMPASAQLQEASQEAINSSAIGPGTSGVSVTSRPSFWEHDGDGTPGASRASRPLRPGRPGDGARTSLSRDPRFKIVASTSSAGLGNELSFLGLPWRVRRSEGQRGLVSFNYTLCGDHQTRAP